MAHNATELDLIGVLELKVSHLIPLEEGILLRQFVIGPRFRDQSSGEELVQLDYPSYLRSRLAPEVPTFDAFLDQVDGFALATRGAHLNHAVFLSNSYVNQRANNGHAVRLAKVLVAIKPDLEEALGKLDLLVPPDKAVLDLSKLNPSEVLND